MQSLNNEGFVITRPRKIAYLLIAVCCLVGVGGALFAYRAPIAKQLSDWRLLPEPERVTELFFTDYSTLPKSFTAGSHHTVAFTVRNLEHQKTVYHYKVIAASDQGAEQSLGDGTFMLDHDRVHLGSADIVVPAFEPRLAIKVELYYQSMTPRTAAETLQTQFINFSAAVTGPGVGKAAL